MPASSERVVVLGRHLHARPAGEVVRAAAAHPDTSVELLIDERNADARSILAIMALGGLAGGEVLIRAGGADPAGAIDAIAAILAAAD
jgi:phosphotransferase system HPr (HPr) family protein